MLETRIKDIVDEKCTNYKNKVRQNQTAQLVNYVASIGEAEFQEQQKGLAKDIEDTVTATMMEVSENLDEQVNMDINS